MDYDFSGWATRNNLKCSDGRTILRDAFKDDDGQIVPLVWNHQHNDSMNVLGHALLENRDDGVYAYCKFNDTESGRNAKMLVEHGDVSALSIYANKLKQKGHNVLHGAIREVSLVLAGANPGAFIDSVMQHGDGIDDEAVIYTGESIYLCHADDEEESFEEDDYMDNEETVADVFNTLTDKQKTVVYAMIGQALEEAGVDDYDDSVEHSDMYDYDYDDFMYHADDYDDATVADVFNSLTEDQKMVVYAMIGQALEDAGVTDEEDADMKHNVFDVEDDYYEGGFLTHSDEEAIIEMAKTPGVGSFQEALKVYAEDNQLQHDAFDGETMGALLPDYELLDPRAPKILYPDDTWVSSVINGVHKSPIARVRTRRADARQAELKAHGYKKGEEKKYMGQIKLLGRSHDPQTIYIKDKLNRDDIIDITDFDIVSYQWDIMRHTLDQTLATAILIGDGRDDDDPDKIKEDRIRPIWKDDDMYCIHQDIDIAAAKAELQGTDTNKHFGDNYVYAEAVITAALYSREKYKGSGNLTFYCTPHLLNVMLLARDLNGRRIYSSKSDLIAALNVKDIQTIEQFEGLTRKTEGGKTKKMLGLFVNLADYQLGCVKGGEITKFDQFDIDFNQQKMLMETRVSGALVEWYSAIALEEDVTSSKISG